MESLLMHLSSSDQLVKQKKLIIPNKTSLSKWVWAYFGPLDNLNKGNIWRQNLVILASHSAYCNCVQFLEYPFDLNKQFLRIRS